MKILLKNNKLKHREFHHNYNYSTYVQYNGHEYGILSHNKLSDSQIRNRALKIEKYFYDNKIILEY